MFDTCDGYIDWTKREIYVRDYFIDSDEIEYKNIATHMNKPYDMKLYMDFSLNLDYGLILALLLTNGL